MKKLKEKMSAKLSKNGGFTLVEMLIVVAIIAILIAVSIPLVSNALEKTKHATDEANERAAKAEIMIQYLADTDAVIDGNTGTAIVADKTYYYDAANGMLSAGRGDFKYGQHGDHKDAMIALQIDANGKVSMVWTKTGPSGTVDNSGLCSGHNADSCTPTVK